MSDELRQALGLHNDKLPMWIYRMRILGYPPGWLKEADMSKTVVPIIDGDEQESTHQEVDKSKFNFFFIQTSILVFFNLDTWNIESLISYPGFNSPLPKGVRDDHQILGMPPMIKHQQLDFATANMKKPAPVPYKRIRIATSEVKESESTDDKLNESNNKNKSQDEKIIENGGNSVEETTSQPTPTKLISVGVPVPEVVKKPPLVNWSENNSLAPLIYFENLPNYTGVFNKIRSVIGVVRNKLSNIQTKEETPGPSNVESPSSPTSPDSPASQTSPSSPTLNDSTSHSSDSNE